MNKEIKEKIKYLKTYASMMQSVYLTEIEDYIINLQEKVNQYENPDDLTLFYMWIDEKAKDKMKALQEENKMYAQLKDEYEDIIDKAIEIYENS